MNKEEKLKLNASHYANSYLNGWVKEGEWMRKDKNAYSIIVPWDGARIWYSPSSKNGSLEIWVGTEEKRKKTTVLLPENADLREMRPPIYDEGTKCAKFVIPKKDDNEPQYSHSDLHKMLCDAYIAGNNDTLDDALYRKAYYDDYNKCNRDWIYSQEGQKASYTTIVETGDGGINALVTRELPTDGCDDEQKPADTVEPKFHEGDWVFIEEVKGYKNGPFQIKTVDSFGYSFDEYHTIPFMYEDILSKWTIKDAKDGDVLAYVTDEEDLWIMIYQSLYEPYEGHVHYHALLVNDNFSDKGTCCICINDLKPATKEQCDLLFQKMKEAVYTFDFEKKELKKMEQKYTPKYKVGDTIYYNSFGELKSMIVAYVTTDSTDNPMYEDVNGSAVFEKDIVGYNTEWSEEDEKMFRSLHNLIYVVRGCDCDSMKKRELSDWLKSLKDRVQPQPKWSEEDEKHLKLAIDNFQTLGNSFLTSWLKSLKGRVQLKQEWNEEDEKCIRLSIDIIDSALRAGFCVQLDRDRCVDWLKSLKPQKQWKPTKEQMQALKEACDEHWEPDGLHPLYTLYEQIKQL